MVGEWIILLAMRCIDYSRAPAACKGEGGNCITGFDVSRGGIEYLGKHGGLQ